MKLSTVAGLVALAASANAHATFQYFWTDSGNQASSTNTCARLPSSNSPLSSTGSNIACNSPASPASSTCAVSAGATVAVEMHQQPGDRSCSNEAIGGNHDGPTIIYMAKVGNAASTGTSGLSWFKVAQTGLVSASGSTYVWGTDTMNSNCGKVVFKIPCGIASGDYLVRAEVIALHVAGSAGGAQHYATCFQVNVASTGSTVPSGVSFPGAYGANDPGIKFDIYGSYTSYTVPGPAVYSGSGSCSGQPPASSQRPASTVAGSTARSSSGSPPQSSSGGCMVAKYGQCGGNGWTGCTVCTGSTCTKSNDFYSQCL